MCAFSVYQVCVCTCWGGKGGGRLNYILNYRALKNSFVKLDFSISLPTKTTDLKNYLLER